MALNEITTMIRTLLSSALLLCFFGHLAVAGPPAADPTTKLSAAQKQAVQKAKTYNAVAKKLFSLRLFNDAAEQYKKAYQALPKPIFLFNIAQCYKRMSRTRNLERAVFFFESYLRNEPDSPFADRVTGEIDKLRKDLARARAPKPFYRKWWFWTAVGAAAAGLTVGLTVGLAPEAKFYEGTANPGVATIPDPRPSK